MIRTHHLHGIFYETYTHPVANDVGNVVTALSHVLAGGSSGEEQRRWSEGVLSALVAHPDVMVRCAIAAGGSLGVLRKAALDPDPAVRLACTFNPFVIDADVQLVLAADTELAVVQSLLDHVDPSVEAAWAIIRGPHRLARLRLARRPLRTELLLALGYDRHRAVRTAAAISLGNQVVEVAA